MMKDLISDFNKCKIEPLFIELVQFMKFYTEYIETIKDLWKPAIKKTISN